MVPLAMAMLEEEKAGKIQGATLQILGQSPDKLREGASDELLPEEPGSFANVTDRQKPGTARYHGYDQLDDWHHRGPHPIFQGMSLYEYSRWIYRVEFCPYDVANAKTQRRKPQHIDIPFDEDYALSATWIQRVSREPRVPRIEGMKFESKSNPRDALHVEVRLAAPASPRSTCRYA